MSREFKTSLKYCVLECKTNKNTGSRDRDRTKQLIVFLAMYECFLGGNLCKKIQLVHLVAALLRLFCIFINVLYFTPKDASRALFSHKYTPLTNLCVFLMLCVCVCCFFSTSVNDCVLLLLIFFSSVGVCLQLNEL